MGCKKVAVRQTCLNETVLPCWWPLNSLLGRYRRKCSVAAECLRHISVLNEKAVGAVFCIVEVWADFIPQSLASELLRHWDNHLDVWRIWCSQLGHETFFNSRVYASLENWESLGKLSCPFPGLKSLGKMAFLDNVLEVWGKWPFWTMS